MLYHVWFSTKRRKRLLVGEVEAAAKRLFVRAAVDNDIDLRECECMPDHAHLLLSVAPEEISRSVKLLKGISARRLFQTFPDLKLDGRTNHIWQRGFGSRPVTDGAAGVAWYIRTQKSRLAKYDR